MRRYVMIEKAVGETPLTALERYRTTVGIASNVPMAYAGRLDPMADGKLLILIGDECKRQKEYHGLDKEYIVQVLFDISSDTGDVLGRLDSTPAPTIASNDLQQALTVLKGDVRFPYPHFSAKTVAGKPLHVWTLEDRLDEIEIPTYTAKIHRLVLVGSERKSGHDIARAALQKIERIPPVTDTSKALGNDFRRTDVRADWEQFAQTHGDEMYTIATIRCTCSSGLYMRTLADAIAQKLNTRGLAYHIHRTKIGRYRPILGFPFWQKP